MYRFINLPPKGSEVECVVEPHCFRVQTEDGWRVCEISRVSYAATASDIARAIISARDAGYDQALANLRNELGIK